MKKDKKKKSNNSKRNKPSYYQELLKEYWIEIKYNKLYYSTILLIALFAFFSLYFQYTYEKSQRQNRQEDNGLDYYEILGLDSSADLAMINRKYRELAKIWHPDKNPGCTVCQEKFREITLAHEVLSKETNSDGSRSMFRSNPVVLTTRNYHKLVEMSNYFWIILVYENTKGNSFVEHVKNVWDEVAVKNKNVVKFGVIDVLSQEDMLHFLPFKFQYFPNIFSYNHNNCELFSKIDQLSPSNLQQFIENSFNSHVEIISDYYLNSLLKNMNKHFDINDSSINFKDLDLQVINLSSRSYVELATKDFSMTYSNSLKIYQNEYGEFERFSNILKTHGVSRNYVIFNRVLERKGEFIMEKRILNLPMTSKYESVASLQKSFELIKSISFLRLYSQTYNNHCLNKRPESQNLEKENFNDVCVIFLENKQNKNQNQKIFKSFIETVQELFEERLKEDVKEKNSVININYAVSDINTNYEIAALMKKFESAHNVEFNNHENLFFIINNTNERFVFKQFKTSEAIKEYFSNLSKTDYFEDISLSFDFLANYDIKTVHSLFVEEKHFSLIRALISSVHSQFQSKHVFAYFILLLVNHYIFKYNSKKFIITVFCTSTTLSLIVSLIFYFI